MQAADRDTVISLEKRFWQSLVDEEADTAIGLLTEPAYMVSPHGAMKFDHAMYRKMAEQGSQVVQSYEFSDMDATFPSDDTAILTYKVKQVISPRGKNEPTEQSMSDTSTWVRVNGEWRCAMHTETPNTQQQKR